MLPKISVNIPLKHNGNASVVLQSLTKVKYPHHKFEILIIVGNHIAKQRNTGVNKSKGEIIYLLDDDSQVHPLAFFLIAKEFKNKKIAAVGGPSLISKKNKNYLNQLIGYVLETYFGAFRMRYKWNGNMSSTYGKNYHFIGANLAIRKKAIQLIGKFDEKIVPNEETELLERLQYKGYLLKFSRDLYIYRNHRKNITALSKQFHHYGKGRMKQIKKRLQILDLLLVTPILFGMYVFSLFFFHPLWYFAPLVAYILLAFATAAKASIKYKNASLLVTMPLIFPIVHFSYATGMISEIFLKEKLKKTMPVKIIHVKRFTTKTFHAF